MDYSNTFGDFRPSDSTSPEDDLENIFPSSLPPANPVRNDEFGVGQDPNIFDDMFSEEWAHLLGRNPELNPSTSLGLGSHTDPVSRQPNVGTGMLDQGIEIVKNILRQLNHFESCRTTISRRCRSTEYGYLARLASCGSFSKS